MGAPGDDEHHDEQPRTPPRKDKARARPDRPTESDEATLVERDDGANSEFADAPESLGDEPST